MCSTHQSAALAADVLLGGLANSPPAQGQAAREMRLLLAYAREFATPRPYRLVDLAEAAGMSVSGIRTAYTPPHCRCQHSARRAQAARPGT